MAEAANELLCHFVIYNGSLSIIVKTKSSAISKNTKILYNKIIDKISQQNTYCL
jgi:hypothetical protein